MPAIKCSNGKWKYGEKGGCDFDTKAEAQRAGLKGDGKEKPLKDRLLSARSKASKSGLMAHKADIEDLLK